MKKESMDARRYHRTRMQKEIIIEELRGRGCRITRQRLMLLDIILEEECSSCKEIYYRAAQIDKKIGTATVYRMINTLEEIGAISRKNMYRVACRGCSNAPGCTIEFSDSSSLELTADEWNRVIAAGLSACGFGQEKSIAGVIAASCSFES